MKPWLIEDWEMDVALEHDIIFHTYIENGIISPKVAELQFIMAAYDDDYLKCPKCLESSRNHTRVKNGQWLCKTCRSKYSITSMRYIDNTKIPLTHWWRFCYHFENMNRPNSCFLARDLMVTQATAWLMIKTIKQAIKETSDIVLVNGVINIKSLQAMNFLMRTIKK